MIFISGRTHLVQLGAIVEPGMEFNSRTALSLG